MTIQQYLEGLIEDQRIADNFVTEMRKDRQKIEKILAEILELKDNTTYYGGSYGKNTMIKESYDLDILFYFPEEHTSSLKDLYFKVKDAIIAKNPSAYQKNVAIRIDKREGYHIDIVPAKRILNSDGDAFIYKSKENLALKTNVSKHIETIKKFARRDILKLLKLWKVRNNIEIPSFLLELIAIQVTKSDKESIEEALKRIFRFLSKRITTCNIPDPANGNNNIASNDVANLTQKEKCKKVASWSLEQNFEIEEGWKEIFRKKPISFEFNTSDDKQQNSSTNNNQEQKKPRISADSPKRRFA